MPTPSPQTRKRRNRGQSLDFTPVVLIPKFPISPFHTAFLPNTWPPQWERGLRQRLLCSFTWAEEKALSEYGGLRSQCVHRKGTGPGSGRPVTRSLLSVAWQRWAFSQYDNVLNSLTLISPLALHNSTFPKKWEEKENWTSCPPTPPK